jgi:signal transduction histidine kinase
MAKHRSHYTDSRTAKRRLCGLLAVFFAALALPVYLLLAKVYSQLENEAYFNQRQQAELATQRIEQRLLEIIETEQNRPIAEYSFFNILENPLLQSSSVKFSPLSEIPPRSTVPGLTGYFQIDSDGSFTTPALPDLDTDKQSGLSVEELDKRIALKTKLQNLLAADNRSEDDNAENAADEPLKPEAKSKAAEPEKQAYRFDAVLPSSGRDADSLSAGSRVQAEAKDESAGKLAKKARKLSAEQLQQLNIDAKRWQQKPNPAADKESNYLARKETVKLPSQSLGALFERRQIQPAAPADEEARQEASASPQPAVGEVTAGQKPIRILSFESEVGPLQFIRLNAEYFCFFRQVWRNNSRYIQGFIINGGDFFAAALQPLLGNAQAASFSSILLAYDDALLKQFRLSPAAQEILLYRDTLAAPLNAVELIVNSGPSMAGVGSRLVDILAVALGAMLFVGAPVFYRLGAGQIELAQRQRNFISAVSHELKTPLTSIRMYAEMLRADWITDAAKKRTYYDFIFFESERLSRLIANVLQLAKLDNHIEKPQLIAIAPEQLLQRIKEKVAVQIEAAAFQLNLITCAANAENLLIAVDEDAFSQIVINLVDNALKFSTGAELKAVDVGLKILSKEREAVFFVRDYGPGIDRKQLKKIFQLFYRPGDELTRTKPGTGIGLALVVQLADRMNAKIDVLNRSPGAEFQVKLQASDRANASDKWPWGRR